MGVLKKIRPISVNTDVDELLMKDEEARHIKNYRIDQNANGNLQTGTGSNAPSGANFGMRTKLQSNKKVYNKVQPLLPAGFNKKIGGKYIPVTNEYYYMNYNSNGNHGIYVIYGDTMEVDTVLLDPKLNFSHDPLFEIPEHCCELWVTYDSDDVSTRKIKEKYLLWTDSNNWQGYLNVIASIKTNGFDASQYPYWTLKQPHFDRRELFEWAVRPIMPAPEITPLPITAEDKGKNNGLLLRSFQFAVEVFYTDGRPSTLSQWSETFHVDKTSCNLNSQNLTRCVDLKIYAGSPMTERIRILVRNCANDWYAVETINKFSTCGPNDPAIIGDEYWKRINPWEDYSYDPEFNTITYRFCNNKECKQVSQVDALRLQSDLPIKSTAATAVGNGMLLSNNLYDYDNLPCEEINKVKLDVEQITSNVECLLETRKITLYAWIGRGDYDYPGYYNQPGYKLGADTPVYFGGVSYFNNGTLKVDTDESNLFGLTFGDKKGPLMYLAGTPYYAIGKQMKVDKNMAKEEIGVFDFNIQANKDLVKSMWGQGDSFVWQFEFLVPAGKYIARMAGHDCKETEDYAKTSTYIVGLSSIGLKSSEPIIFSTQSEAKEMEVDCCNGDVDMWLHGNDVFLLYCPIDYKEGTNHRWRFITGNVYEDSVDKVPVELVRYVPDQGDPNKTRTGFHTDHNGFYFAFAARGDAKKANVDFWSKFNCAIRNQASRIAKTSGLPNKDRGYYPGTHIYVNTFNGAKFGKCNRVLVRGRVMDCDGTTGLEGVSVTITRGGTVTTVADGTFELVVHNSWEQVRQDRIYFNTGGVCLFSTCNCQCPVLENYTDAIVPCINCNERIYPVTLERRYRLAVKALKSLKGGGRYGIGMTGFDLAGRLGYVNNIDYKDVPTFLEKGRISQSFIRWTLSAPLSLPDHVKWVSFWRTPNLNYSSYLQWVGDKIEFLDVNGAVIENPVNAIRARVTIQSLNEFNKAQTFGNTTNYQFVQGDMLRIYDNGDGKMFDPLGVYGFLDYDILGTNWNAVNEDLGVVETTVTTGSTAVKTVVPKEDGKSFIIPFDKKLIDLQKKCGFWIEIMRLKNCTTVQKYCEVAKMYPVINGQIVRFDGLDANGAPMYTSLTTDLLNTWDTYFQKRFLRIKDCGGKLFNHPFESSAISDYWGDNCSSCGREHVENENANQRWHPLDSIKSDDFINDGGYNGLGTFRDINRKKFKGQHLGGIVASYANNNIVAMICTNDWFLTDFNLNTLRIGDNGVVVANLDNSLGEPRQKIGDNFGVALEDKGQVIFTDEFATWPDSKRAAIVLMNYRGAEDISMIENKSYFTDKFNFINKFNSSLLPADYKDNLIDKIMGYDHKYNEILVTFRPRRGLTDDVMSFINDERETFVDMQETFVYHVEMKKWVRFAGYAPESYGRIPKGKFGDELLTFANGEAYRHNSSDVNTFNTFFGVKTQSLMRIIYNEAPSKEKILQSLAVESNSHKHIVTSVKSNELNCFSYIPEAFWKKKENIWYAEFLRDMNSFPSTLPQDAFRKMLIDGKRLFGTFFDITIVGDLLKLDEYCELNNIIIRAIGSEQSDK